MPTTEAAERNALDIGHWRWILVIESASNRILPRNHIRNRNDGLKRVLDRASGDGLPICVLGDFNQRIPRVNQPINVYEKIIQAIPSSFRITTKGLVDSEGENVIDHMAISDNLKSGTPTIIPRYASEGTQLSDHVGIVSILTT